MKSYYLLMELLNDNITIKEIINVFKKIPGKKTITFTNFIYEGNFDMYNNKILTINYFKLIKILENHDSFVL